MAQVFISYSRRDLTFVEKLVSDLKKIGLNVWYDLSGLEGGSRWGIEIRNAIKNSGYVIVVLSPDSVESEWVEREYLFSSNQKKKILPIMYRECELPLAFLNMHCIDVQGENYSRNFGKITNFLNTDSVLAHVKNPSRKKYGTILKGIPRSYAIVGAVATLGIVGMLLLFDTNILTPAPTPAPPAIGSDWANGCISVLWQPYPDTIPTTQNNGCLVEPVNVFFAADGGLTFLVNGRFDDTEVFGFFAPLPASGSVSISTFLRNLEEGEIWIGVFAEPDVESQGTIVVIPPGNVRERELVQKNMSGREEVQRTAQFAQNPPIYDVVFEFGNDAVSIRMMRDMLFNAARVETNQPWFFVGYQVEEGNNLIDADFLNLIVQEQ